MVQLLILDTDELPVTAAMLLSLYWANRAVLFVCVVILFYTRPTSRSLNIRHQPSSAAWHVSYLSNLETMQMALENQIIHAAQFDMEQCPCAQGEYALWLIVLLMAAGSTPSPSLSPTLHKMFHSVELKQNTVRPPPPHSFGNTITYSSIEDTKSKAIQVTCL